MARPKVSHNGRSGSCSLAVLWRPITAASRDVSNRKAQVRLASNFNRPIALKPLCTTVLALNDLVVGRRCRESRRGWHELEKSPEPLSNINTACAAAHESGQVASAAKTGRIVAVQFLGQSALVLYAPRSPASGRV